MDLSTLGTNQTSFEEYVNHFISQKALDQFALVTHVIFIPVICILGLVGNSLGIFLLRRDSRIHSVSFHFYMTALLATQIFLLIMGAVRSVPEMIKLYDQVFGNYLEQYMLLYLLY